MEPSNKYPQAFAEVLEVLKYLPREDQEKIPKDVLNKLMGEADTNSNFSYNIGVPFSEQEVSKEAKQILANFNRRYFSAPAQKA